MKARTTKVRTILLVLLVLLLTVSPLSAHAATSITVLSYAVAKDAPVLHVSVRPVASGHLPENIAAGGFLFSAPDGTTLPIMESEGSTGHIIVVDRMEYYNRHITATHVSAMVKAYLQLLPAHDLVKFIYADASLVETPYMAVSAAINQMNTLVTLYSGASDLSVAVSTALTQAANETKQEPYCRAVAIIANPCNALKLSEVTAVKNKPAHLTVIVPTRPQYEQGPIANAERYQDYLQGRQMLNKLVLQFGGSYFETPVTGSVSESGDDTNTIINLAAVAGASPYLDCIRNFTIDLKPLGETADAKQSNQRFDLDINAGQAKETLTITVPVALLPTPAPPAADTPEPSPTPVVNIGDNTVRWRRVRLVLQNNYYLDKNKVYETFDAEAQAAFDRFCEINGIPLSEGIDAEAYALLTEGSVIPHPTATPIPAATPAVQLGDSTVEWRRMRLALQNSYYLDTSKVYESYDSEAQAAFDKFCEINDLPITEGIDADTYELLLSGNFLPCPTATPSPSPSPSPSPTPEPTATPGIPAEGMRLQDRDGDPNHPGTFIARLQSNLQALNCFEAEYKPGEFDEPTLQAVNLYCQTYALSNELAEVGASKSLCETILETQRVPRTIPQPSLVDRIKEFLVRPLMMLGSFEIKMWMAVALCAALLIGIIIIIGIMRSGQGSDDVSVSSGGISRIPVSGQNPDVYNPLVTTPSSSAEDRTLPEGVTSTMPEGFGMPVSLRIEYLGGVRHESPVISGPYTMGRKDCSLQLDPSDRNISGKHAILYAENGQLFLRDLNSTNGTYVNGNRVGGRDAQSALSDKTMVLDEATEQESGYLLNRGDEIRMGKHHITVSW